jgi:AraC-like DNA-binding protein
MLKERKMNVSQCAFAVGYSNVGHFISAYKKLYGITPKQTMRQMQELTN